jgi:rhodanese-related sulfurtransferase
VGEQARTRVSAQKPAQTRVPAQKPARVPPQMPAQLSPQMPAQLSPPQPGGTAWISAVDALLAQARLGLDRVAPADLLAEMDAGALVVDTRPAAQRARDGKLPGALVIDRNVLEWRLDPTSPHRIPGLGGRERRIIVVCNEGYASSLAAATLRQLDLTRATDLEGSYQAWLALQAGSTVHLDRAEEPAP